MSTLSAKWTVGAILAAVALAPVAQANCLDEAEYWAPKGATAPGGCGSVAIRRGRAP